MLNGFFDELENELNERQLNEEDDGAVAIEEEEEESDVNTIRGDCETKRVIHASALTDDLKALILPHWDFTSIVESVINLIINDEQKIQ